jgi:hypothetical protein
MKAGRRGKSNRREVVIVRLNQAGRAAFNRINIGKWLVTARRPRGFGQRVSAPGFN